MRLAVAMVVAVGLFAGITSAHAARAGGRPRLGVFHGVRVNNTFIEGKSERPLTASTDVRIKTKGGRLYITMTPPNCTTTRCWSQSFKILKDEHQPGIGRTITYQRDSNGRAKRSNEAVFAKLWGPSARLVDMKGSGTILVPEGGKSVRWINVGQGTMLVTEGGKEVPGNTSWSETFHGQRPGYGTAAQLAAPLVAP